MRRSLLAVLVSSALAAACSPRVTDLPSAAPGTVDAPDVPADVFETLLPPADALTELCDPENDQDRLTDVFCAPDAQPPTGLDDLLVKLGLDFKDPNGGNGVGGNPGFAILGHSSALTARKVTTITPTTFIFTPPEIVAGREVMPPDYTFLAFDPAEHFVEIASNSPDAEGGLNLYLLIFEQACESAPGGCSNVDLFTNAITTGWTNVRAYEDTGDVDNTIAGCPVCHDPTTTGERMLRMQENSRPFTHWFSAKTEGGKALLADFHAAHGTNEKYGAIPAALIDKSDPALMAHSIALAGFADQPNVFDSAAIENDVCGSSAEQPANNVPMGTSPAWDAIYDAAVKGNFIATPYHDVKVTDPTKLAVASSAYQDWLAGLRADLPVMNDVFFDDGLRDMGFAPKAGLNGRELLQQMCQECHNAHLSMDLTRERFLVDQLDAMTREERDLAIQRIGLRNTRLQMPPPLFRTMTESERLLMIDELAKEPGL